RRPRFLGLITAIEKFLYKRVVQRFATLVIHLRVAHAVSATVVTRVIFPPSRARLATHPSATGTLPTTMTNRDRRRRKAPHLDASLRTGSRAIIHAGRWGALMAFSHAKGS